MVLQVLAPNGVSVYRTTGVSEQGFPVTEDMYFERGKLLPEWLDSHQAFVLATTGMAAEVGDNPDEAVRPYDLSPAPVLLPEHNPASVVLPDGRTAAAALAQASGEKPVSEGEASGELPPLPADTDTKYVWETYAASKLPQADRMTRPEAEAMKKSDLVTEVKARFEAASVPAEDEPVLSPKF